MTSRTALRNTEARLARMTAVAEDLAAEQGPAGQLVELLAGIADLAEGIEAMTDALVARLEW